MSKKHCQFYGILDKELCKKPRTHRLLEDGDPIGEVCEPHEREMRERYPTVASEPIRKRKETKAAD